MAGKAGQVRPKESEPLSPLDQALIRFRFANPTYTIKEIAKEFGLQESACYKRFEKKASKELSERINHDLWEQAKGLRDIAVRNAYKHIKDSDTDKGFEITKMFLKQISESPTILPEAAADMPEFYDPDGSER